MRKRMLALLLALVMCLSLLPTAAFAESDTDTTDTDGGTTDTYTDTTAATTPVAQSRAATPVALAAGTHSNHCTCATEHESATDICSGSGLTLSQYLNPLGTESLPASGNYYLTENVTLGSTWEVTGEGAMLVLCLNGHTITANGDFPAITVSGGATLYLTDCATTPGTITHADGKSGSGVKVESTGTFNLYNGSITGNSGTLRTNEDRTSGNCGGGVYIASGGTFNMYGGSITGNTAAGSGFACGGGGVYIEPVHEASGGTFNMYGGSITGNEATGNNQDGGGVFVGDCGAFNMSGGTISGNSANRGGGVYVNSGLLHISVDNVTFTMSGGSITGNNATEEGGGVYGGAYHPYTGGETMPSDTAQGGNTFQLSGSAIVTDNTLNGTKGTDGKYTGGTKNNMYVPSWVYSIHVASDFSGSFGVTVDEEEWADSSVGVMQGTYWKVVRYEGSSNFPGFDYDNQHFTLIKTGGSTGMLQCNHYESTNTTCTTCGAALNIEVTIAPAGGASSITYYFEKPTAVKTYINNKTDITNTTPVTIKLLNNVEEKIGDESSSNATLLITKPCQLALDLNGKTLTANVDFQPYLTSGALTITGIGTLAGSLGIGNASADISGGSFNKLNVYINATVKLSGGTFGKVVNSNNGDVYSLLVQGYAYRTTTTDNSWKVPDANTYQLENVSVQAAPITAVRVGFATGSSQNISYGGSTTLKATVTTLETVTGTVTYQWYRHKDADGATPEKLEGATESTYTATDLGGGTYYFYCDATVDGYTMRGSTHVNVNKATLSDTIKPTAVENLTFKTQKVGSADPEAVAQQLVNAPASLDDGCTVYYRLGESGEFATAIPTATNAGTYTVYWYIVGSDNYNDMGSATSPAGSVEVTIAPKKVAEDVPPSNPNGIEQLKIKHWDSRSGTWFSDGLLTYTYTGSPIRPTIQLEDPYDYVIPASGYSVEYKDNTIATTLTSYPTIIIKDTNPNDNFEITDSEFPFTISKATVVLSPGEYTHYVIMPLEDLPITFNLTEIAEALGMPANDGPLTLNLSTAEPFTGPAGDGQIDMTIDDGKLKLSGAYVTENTPYTAKVLVSSNNHQGSFTLKVDVSNKTVPSIDGSGLINKDYDGTALTLDQAGAQFDPIDRNDGSRITAGTWSWNAPEGKPKTVADSGKYLLTFTPSDDTTYTYTPATKVVQVTIKPRSLADSSITATADGGTYTGSAIEPTNLTVKYGTVPLVEGTDYTIVTGEGSDLSATYAGTYHVKIEGIGNYTDERMVEWKIAPKPLEDDVPTNDTPYKHDPIRRQPLFISTIGDSGNASGNGTDSGSSVASPDTGDVGIALYGVLSVLSLTGGAWIRRRKF